MAETVLIVDDEQAVRKTFRGWLVESGLDIEVLDVGDAEGALTVAARRPIDLAVLDWNLGSGSDGLRLLEDLIEFQPDLTAILVTGFAHQATPLDALRMGVRDYLDKNQNLTRDVFTSCVSRQIAKIVPAKKLRTFNARLRRFRESVERILPLVRSAGTLNDPVPLPEAVRKLFQFLMRTTGAVDGVLVGRHVPHGGVERVLVYSADGARLADPPVPFGRSIAAAALGMSEPCVMTRADFASLGTVELQPFERDRSAVLAAPVQVSSAVQVVLELFDKPDGFTAADRRLVSAGADFSAELLRQVLAERRNQDLLIDAVEAALDAGESDSGDPAHEQAVPAEVMNQLKAGLSERPDAIVDAETSLRLAESIRELAVRHGTPAVRHCLTLIDEVRKLLDETTGFATG